MAEYLEEERYTNTNLMHWYNLIDKTRVNGTGLLLKTSIAGLLHLSRCPVIHALDNFNL